MSLIPTASEAPTFAEVVSGKRKPSQGLECYLLKRLPRGKRQSHNHPQIPSLLTISPEIRDDIGGSSFSTLVGSCRALSTAIIILKASGPLAAVYPHTYVTTSHTRTTRMKIAAACARMIITATHRTPRLLRASIRRGPRSQQLNKRNSSMKEKLYYLQPSTKEQGQPSRISSSSMITSSLRSFIRELLLSPVSQAWDS